MAYARELCGLQQRFGAVQTDRVCWPPRHARAPVPPPEPEIADIHVHDDREVRVLLAGRARFVLASGEAGTWTAIDCEGGDWLALPPGLPHALLPVPGDRVDMLRLFARPRGWVPHRTDAGRPPALWAEPLAQAA